MDSQYDTLVKRATSFAVLSAIVLFSSKIVAWWFTGSVSMLASVFDSGIDIFTSLTNLVLIRYALKPADNDHAFGHGKAEPLSALIQSAFILGAVILLIIHSIDGIKTPKELEIPALAIITTIFSIVSTGFLLGYQTYVVNKTNSSAIKTDVLHYRADFLLNIAVLVALGLTIFGLPYADPIFSLLISFYILYSVVHIVYGAIQVLMDKALSQEITDSICQIALSFPAVNGIHGIKTRQSGKTKFIQLHLEFDDDMRLIDSHTISDLVEAALYAKYPNSDIIIHQDPISVVEKECLTQGINK